MARWPPSRCQGCGCLVHVPCVCTVHSLVRCVENLSAYQIRSRLSGAVLRVVRDEPHGPWAHDRIARSCLATLHYRWRPRTAVGPRCTLHTHTFCRHTVPSKVCPVQCVVAPLYRYPQPSLSPSHFKVFPVSSVTGTRTQTRQMKHVFVFTCSLGSLCFFEIVRPTAPQPLA